MAVTPNSMSWQTGTPGCKPQVKSAGCLSSACCWRRRTHISLDAWDRGRGWVSYSGRTAAVVVPATYLGGGDHVHVDLEVRCGPEVVG